MVPTAAGSNPDGINVFLCCSHSSMLGAKFQFLFSHQSPLVQSFTERDCNVLFVFRSQAKRLKSEVSDVQSRSGTVKTDLQNVTVSTPATFSCC